MTLLYALAASWSTFIVDTTKPLERKTTRTSSCVLSVMREAADMTRGVM